MFFLIPYFGSDDGDPDRLRYAATFSAVFAVPALVGVLGIRRGTPRYTMAAGIVIVPLSLLSIVLFPMAIFGVLMATGAATLIRPDADWKMEVPVSIVIVLGPIVAMAMLIASKETVEWRTPTSHHVSQQTTWSGYVVAWAFLALTLAVSLIRDRRTAARVALARRRPQPSDLPV